MEKGERDLIRSARIADIEGSEQEQVFSQLIGMVNKLESDSSFTIDFGSDETGFQSTLDGLGLGTIKDAEPRVTSIYRTNLGVVSNNFGLNKRSTGGKILPMLGELPVSKSLQAILSGGWRDLSSTDSMSEITFEVSPGSDLMARVSCHNSSNVAIPDWDYWYAQEMLKSDEYADKINWLGGLLGAADDDENVHGDDSVIFPGQRYRLCIARIGEFAGYNTFDGRLYVPGGTARIKYSRGNLVGDTSSGIN